MALKDDDVGVAIFGQQYGLFATSIQTLGGNLSTIFLFHRRVIALFLLLGLLLLLNYQQK
jgi:hypothetical protein